MDLVDTNLFVVSQRKWLLSNACNVKVNLQLRSQLHRKWLEQIHNTKKMRTVPGLITQNTLDPTAVSLLWQLVVLILGMGQVGSKATTWFVVPFLAILMALSFSQFSLFSLDSWIAGTWVNITLPPSEVWNMAPQVLECRSSQYIF